MRQGKLLVLVGAIFLVLKGAFAQQGVVRLSGKAVDEIDRAPVPGVTISVKDIQRIYTTDKDGMFELVLPRRPEYQMTMRRIGFDPLHVNMKIDKDTVVTITLKPADNVLEEVTVNTGYQSIPKERATGSFEVVNAELFNRQIGTDVISRLDGIMPSILFDKRTGAEQRMVIRGVSSLSAIQGAPLIVLDNFPFEGDINSINPNDVESVTLLKDAAAASIWGAKAGNGVLVITTKKGKYKAPWQVSVHANSTIQEKPDLYYMPRMSTSDFIDIEQFLYEQGAFTSMLANTTNRPPLTPVIELLDEHTRGEISETTLKNKLDYFREQDIRKDLSNHFYRTGINQQYSFSLNGGGENYTTLFSAGYDHNRSTLVGNDFRRINLNIQNTFRLTPRLDLSTGIRYSMLFGTNNHLGNIQMSAAKGMYPYAEFVDEYGQALAVTKDYRNSYLDEVDERGGLLDWRYRPYDELHLADNTTTGSNLLFSTNLKYRFLADLTGEVYYQYEHEPSFGRQFYSEDTYYTRDLINRFTQVADNGIIRPIPLGGILDRSQSELKAQSFRGQINYTKDWANHSIAAIIGMEIRHARNEGNNTRLYGYDDDLQTTNRVDYVNRLPIYDNLAGASTIIFSDRAFGGTQRFVSAYSNGSYTYKKKYTLSVSARKDASNLFGVATNDKWSPLWSVGGAWNIGEEEFYHSNLIPRLKVRTTYGYSGNVRNDVAAVTTLQYYGTSRLGRYPYAVVMNPPNAELRWEKIGTFNLGLDFGFVNNVLAGSIEFYRKTATDLVSLVETDPTTGFGSLSMNSAIIKNTGVDLTLNSNTKLGNTHWSGTLLMSLNRNRIEKYMLEPTRFSQWVGTGSSVSPIEGEPAYSVVSYRWGGLDPETGDPIGYLEGVETKDYSLLNQLVTKNDLVFHGSALPEFFGAFRNTIEWKGVSVSMNIAYRTNYYFRRQTINYSNLLTANGQVEHGDFNERWQQPGDERYTTVPSMIYPTNTRRDEFYRNAEVTVERGDHIRIQDINLSYTFLRNGIKPLRNIRATFYARNLGVIWRANKHNLDPDVAQLPLPKSWSIGLNANF